MYNKELKIDLYIGKKVISQRMLIADFSLQKMEDAGWDMANEIDEEEKITSELTSEWLLKCLTNRQRKVAGLLTNGYSRKDTAQELQISHQAIHQIVLRIRKRLQTRGQVAWS